jgi:hypothetical protein
MSRANRPRDRHSPELAWLAIVAAAGLAAGAIGAVLDPTAFTAT